MSRIGDLPEPDWWAQCRTLKAEGLTIKDIARTCNKSEGAVDWVLHRDKRRTAHREYNAKNPTPKRCQKHYDHKRTHARAEARERWRKEQYSKPLDSYYRALECL